MELKTSLRADELAKHISDVLSEQGAVTKYSSEIGVAEGSDFDKFTHIEGVFDLNLVAESLLARLK